MQKIKNSLQFIPYEELTLTISSRNQYQFSTPWLALDIQAETSLDVHTTLVAFSQKLYEEVDFDMLSDFLKELNLPFNYYRPVAENTGAQDEHQMTQQALAGLTCKTKKEFKTWLGLETSSIDSNEWNWDSKVILEFSKDSINTFSPATLLSIVRRFHLLDCVDYDKTSELYELCKTGLFSNYADLNEILATIVYQNYYVTAECQASLKPALALAQSSSAILTDFMVDEDGHDLLMMRALTSLNKNPEKLFLTDSTKNIMTILKKSGELNFLGFCIAIDFFEKPNFDQIDPLGSLLAHFNKIVAADCLQKHKDINDGGKHEAMALSLLEPLKSVTAENAILALRLAEVLSEEMTSVTRELIQYFSANLTLTTKQA